MNFSQMQGFIFVVRQMQNGPEQQTDCLRRFASSLATFSKFSSDTLLFFWRILIGSYLFTGGR